MQSPGLQKPIRTVFPTRRRLRRPLPGAPPVRLRRRRRRRQPPGPPPATRSISSVMAAAIRAPVDAAPAQAQERRKATNRNYSPATETTRQPFDPYRVKRDFPILQQQVHGKPLIWLDNAATTQKPQSVIDRLSHFYEYENSNIHRAAHALAARSTDAYEAAREKVRRFLKAPSVKDIIFVRGATEGINLVAQAWGRRNVSEGDEIVISWLEHHANIVPWQMLCAEVGARLRVAPGRRSRPDHSRRI